MLHDAAWISQHESAGRHITQDHAAHAKLCPRTDAHSFSNTASSTKVSVRTDANAGCCRGVSTHQDTFRQSVVVADQSVRREYNKVPNYCFRQDNRTRMDDAATANSHRSRDLRGRMDKRKPTFARHRQPPKDFEAHQASSPGTDRKYQSVVAELGVVYRRQRPPNRGASDYSAPSNFGSSSRRPSTTMSGKAHKMSRSWERPWRQAPTRAARSRAPRMIGWRLLPR